MKGVARAGRPRAVQSQSPSSRYTTHRRPGPPGRPWTPSSDIESPGALRSRRSLAGSRSRGSKARGSSYRGARRRAEGIGPAEGEIEDERHRDRGDEHVHRGPSVSEEEIEDGRQLAPAQAERGPQEGHGRGALVRGDVADEGPRDERERGYEEDEGERPWQSVRAGHVAAVEPGGRQRRGGEPQGELIPSAERARLRGHLVGGLVFGRDDVQAPENFHARDAFRGAI